MYRQTSQGTRYGLIRWHILRSDYFCYLFFYCFIFSGVKERTFVATVGFDNHINGPPSGKALGPSHHTESRLIFSYPKISRLSKTTTLRQPLAPLRSPFFQNHPRVVSTKWLRYPHIQIISNQEVVQKNAIFNKKGPPRSPF